MLWAQDGACCISLMVLNNILQSPRVGDKLIATGKWGFTLLEGIFSLFPPSVVLLFDVTGRIFLCNEASHFCPT
jgi:hypothetical protein